MKKLYAILFAILLSLPQTATYAAGYNMLVIPNGLIGATKKGIIGTTDIEENLTVKLIKCIEENNIACSPTLSTLKLSVKNNNNCIQKPNNINNNINAISKAYGVHNVLIISSKIETQTIKNQKIYWNKLNLPVIISQEPNIKIITKVSLINTQTNETIWNNIFYKNINYTNNNINNNSNYTKINAINNYYNTLTPQIINEINANKGIKSIMVITKPNNNTKIYSLKPVSSNNVEPKKIQETKTIDTKNLNTVKPNLNMHETIKPKKDNIFNVLKNNIQLKYDDIRQEYENNQIKKMELNPTPTNKNNNAQVIKNDSKTKEIKETKEVIKTKNNTKTQKTNKNILNEHTKDKQKNDTQKIKQKPIQKINTKKDKEKPNFSTKIKTKYENIKKSYNEYKTNRAKNIKEVETEVDTIDDNAPQLDTPINIKPRNNARNYTPKFDSSVNDM